MSRLTLTFEDLVAVITAALERRDFETADRQRLTGEFRRSRLRAVLERPSDLREQAGSVLSSADPGPTKRS